MLNDVGERDVAGNALRDVAPVPGPRVHIDVGTPAQPDIDAIKRMEGEGNEDESPLQDADEGQCVEELDLLGIGKRSIDRFKVRDNVLDQKRANRDDARQRVQATQKIGVALARAKRLHATNRSGR